MQTTKKGRGEIVSVGCALKRARENAGFSLSQAAKEVGITKSFLWTTEDDRNRIGFDHVVRLCRIYDVDVSTIAKEVTS